MKRTKMTKKNTMTHKTKFSHKVMAVFLILAFLPSLFPVNYLFASNNGPTAPEAASFEPVDATDMVNLATGDLSYVLPLLNVPSPEGGYPLALSYHAGIAMDQEASWVGLGWNLNPGAINRNVSGVPDDWLEAKKYNMMYNDIGVSTEISVGVSAGLSDFVSFGTSLNYSSFKATGGETTHDVGLGVSVNFLGKNSSAALSAGGYLGTNGVGLSAGGSLTGETKNKQTYTYAGANISAFQSFNGEGFNVAGGAFLGNSSGYGGVGINLSSRNGLSANLSGANILLGTNANLNGQLFQETTSFFHLSFYLYSFTFSKNKYWLFDASYSQYNGSLYSGNIDDSYQNILDPFKLGLDTYEATYEADRTQQIGDANFSFIGYDNYTVNGQGIGGSISPRLLENGALISPFNTLRTTTSSGGSYQTPSTNVRYLKPDVASKNFSKSLDQKNVHFYFENEFSTYLNSDSGFWSAPSSAGTYTDLTNISSINKTFTDQKTIDGALYDSYNEANGRLRKANYIETFTNEELLQTPSKIIQPEATGFDRTSPFIPGKGIGAFKITAIDGKTYHYSIPVYHKEQFHRVSNSEDDSDDKFFEQQQFEPYATHWLLTAVTGADYYDNNQNNLVDEGDFGYWVGFEHGKWSDGFAWRSPGNGYRSNGTVDSYSWGIKEVYYLDKVKTRTHTALFVKELREDNKSYVDRISDGTNPKQYNLPFDRSILQARDGVYYFQGTHLDVPVYAYPPTNYNSTSDFWIYADLAEQRSLRLDKIILLKNEDAQSIQKQNTIDVSSIYAGRIFCKAEINLFETATARRIRTVPEDIVPDRTWYGEYYHNILNTADLNTTTITDKIVKTVDFAYDKSYPLSKIASEPTGKLTLSSVNFGGRKGVHLIPPYSFRYFGETTPNSADNSDDWGYYRDNAMMWSLNKITNPLGASIEVTYENDRYETEYASPTTYFESGLEFRFEGTVSGPKTISFRNNADVDSKYHVNFNDYFTAGQTTEIDVLFWHFTQTNSNWIADVAASCVVQQVSDNLIVFAIPSSTNQSWGREYADCWKKDWVYYDGQYGNVVNQTAGWLTETNPNSCERPAETTNRSRYRLFAQKEPQGNAVGGGIRVKELKVSGDDHETKTTYNYLNSNGEESGTTSYALSKRERVIPYVTELPTPMVLYETVTAEKRDANNILYSKKTYQFEVPKPIQYVSNGVVVENALEVRTDQADSYTNISINGENADVGLYKFNVFDYSANIGRLKSTKVYNSEGHLLISTKNSYLPENTDFDQGILKETFSSYKQLRETPLKDRFLLTSSSRLKVPSVLSKTTTFSNGFQQEQQTERHDFFSGQITEASSVLSDGRLYKTKLIPAYIKYPEMGNKADNAAYSHMLAQPAVELMQVKVGEDFITKSANITTWSNEWEYYNEEGTLKTAETASEKKVWRMHKNYVWRGSLDSNGLFQGFNGDDDGFVWGIGSTQTNAEWLNTSTTTLYDRFSSPLEVLDLNNNKAATKKGDKESKVFLVGNSAYDRLFYSGAEDLDSQETHYGGGVLKGTATPVNDPHTGSWALNVAPGGSAFNVSVNNEGSPLNQYRISLWAKATNNQHLNTRLVVDGGPSISYNADEIVRAGDWAQLNFYTSITGTQNINVTASGGSVTVDDFRLHPIYASMTSYVYNQWDELTHILGPNNMGIEYHYDSAGRLIETRTEVQDYGSIGSGGFKKASENQYSYKY